MQTILPVQVRKPLLSHEQLFRSYFDPTPLPAMDAYPSRYNLQRQDLSRFRQDSVDLYKGIHLLQSGQPKQALPFLKKAATNMKDFVTNASEWYLALTYLKLGNIAQAEYLFHKVAETEIHPYQDPAEVIYQQLIKNRPSLHR